MRDAPRQLPDRLHALRLAQGLVLHDLPADVAVERDEAYELAVLIAQDRGHRLGGEALTGLAAVAHGHRLGQFLLAQTALDAPDALVFGRGIIEDRGPLPYQLLGGIAEYAADGRIAQNDFALGVGHENGVGQMVEDRLEKCLLAQGTGAALFRQVVHDAGEIAPAIRRERADRQMHGEDRARLPAPHHLPADADDLALPGLQVVADVAVVPAAKGLRHQQAHVLADELAFRVAEKLLRGGVDRANEPPVVDDDDGADSRLQRGLEHLRAELLVSAGPVRVVHRGGPQRFAASPDIGRGVLASGLRQPGFRVQTTRSISPAGALPRRENPPAYKR